MKKYFLLIINLLVCVILVSAQNYNHEFGKTNPDEFRLTLYDRDSTAEAVVLYRIGKTSYIQDDYGFKMLSEMRVKIKVLTTAGLKWADISIPFYADDNNNKEVVSDLKGNTYNMENNVVRTTPLDCKNTFIEKTEENWKAVKFAMPDVKVGSVLEYSFQEVSPVSFSLNSWKFQLSIPVVYSEFTVSMVPFFEYKYSLQGAKTFDYYNESIDPGLPKRFYGDSYQEKKFLYVMKNVPASKEEPFIDCPEDNLISLEFQLKKISYPGNSVYETSTSWSAIIKELLEEEDFFGKYLHVCEHKAKDFTDTMNLKKATSRMKVERIVNFLKSNFTWDGEFGIYASGKINEFLRTKSGSVAQINLFDDKSFG